jgi:predicted nuclease of predicted toxin-antitoxin system
MILKRASKGELQTRTSRTRTSSSRPSAHRSTRAWVDCANVTLLLDENAPPRVDEALRTEDGLDAAPFRDRGLLESKDHEVLERAFVEHRILATKNVDDFVKVARARELHPVIIPQEDDDRVRDEQLHVLWAAVAELQGERDPVKPSPGCLDTSTSSSTKASLARAARLLLAKS